jgi:hypothetical protein
VKTNEYLLSLSLGFLLAQREKLSDAFALINDDIELAEPAKPGSVSLGGRDTKGEQAGFIQWLDQLRDEKIRDVNVFYASDENIVSLPPHIAAVIEGAEDFILTVLTEKKCRSYTLQTLHSPVHEIISSQFAELIDFQTDRKELWIRVSELVEEFIQMNSIQGFEAHNTRTFLQQGQGAQVFEFLAPQLIQEVQIECYVKEQSFKIPDHLKDLFLKSDHDADPDREDSVYLYAVKNITPADLLELIGSQSFLNEIWETCEKEFKNSPHQEIPALKASEWKEYISKLNGDTLQELCGTICRIIAAICEEKHIRPFIPKELENSFGPDEIENKRAQARGRMVDKWFLQPNSEPWEMYFFELLPDDVKLEKSSDLNKAKADFSKRLKELMDFSIQVGLDFSEALLMGTYFLNDKIPKGNFDENHLKVLIKDLKKNGFSAKVQENLSDLIAIGKNMKMLNWEDTKIHALFALSISDVFDGMESWDDIYFEDYEENENYRKLSSSFFSSHKKYFAAVLSS